MEKSLSYSKRLLQLSLGACLVASAWFQPVAYIGGLPGAYLRSPVGAEAFAMGGAGSASPDHFAVGLNPAMLAKVTATQIDVGGGLRSLGRREGYSSLAYKISPRVGMGLFALYRGDPSLDNLYNENEDLLESGSYTTLTCKMGLSYLFTKKLCAGLALGYFYQRLPSSYRETALDYSTASAIGGFDFAVRYVPSKNWSCAVIFQNVDILKVLSGKSATIEFNWEVVGESFNYAVADRIPAVAVLASRLDLKLSGYPIVWVCDCYAYPFDGDFTKLRRMEVRLNNGVEWKRWEFFSLRAGIGDLLVNSAGIVTDASPRITLGFGADLSKVHRNLRVDYGVATDRVWAGIDQRVDFSFSF